MAWHVQHIPPEAKRAQEERSNRPAHDPSHLDGETDRRQFLLLAAIVYHFSPKGVLAGGVVSAAPAGRPQARLGMGAKNVLAASAAVSACLTVGAGVLLRLGTGRPAIREGTHSGRRQHLGRVVRARTNHYGSNLHVEAASFRWNRP